MPRRFLTPTLTLVTLVVIFQPAAAMAYIGPGVATGAIAAVLGVIGSVLLAVFAVLYYPIKRMMKRRRKATTGAGLEDGRSVGHTPGE